MLHCPRGVPERLRQEERVARSLRWTSADLEVMPFEDGKRYEIIDGELYVSKQPRVQHQLVCSGIHIALGSWNGATHLGFVMEAPGLIFAEDQDVAPDLVWVSRERLPLILQADGHLHAAPELIVEVLSPGEANERRDREAKLGLYSRQGVREYWVVDWQRRQMQVYRRRGAGLELAATHLETDTVDSPLLPGFGLALTELFSDLPSA